MLTGWYKISSIKWNADSKTKMQQVACNPAYLHSSHDLQSPHSFTLISNLRLLISPHVVQINPLKEIHGIGVLLELRPQKKSQYWKYKDVVPTQMFTTVFLRPLLWFLLTTSICCCLFLSTGLHHQLALLHLNHHYTLRLKYKQTLSGPPPTNSLCSRLNLKVHFYNTFGFFQHPWKEHQAAMPHI